MVNPISLVCWLSCRHAPLVWITPTLSQSIYLLAEWFDIIWCCTMPCPWERKPATQIKAAEVIERQYLPPLATDLQMESERNFTPVEMHLGLIFRSAALCFCCATLGERQTLLSLISSRQHASGITGVTLCNGMFLKSLPLLTATASPWIFGRTSILTYWPPQLSTCWFRWA